MTNQKEPTPATQAQPSNDLAIVSLVLGIMSLTGPGLLLGIPAIITGSIALKKNQNNRNLSITGLITGIVSTVFSLIFLVFIAFVIVWSIDNPGDLNQPSYQYRQNGQPQRSSQT